MITSEDPTGIEDAALAVGDAITSRDLSVVDQLAALAQALGFVFEHARHRGELKESVSLEELQEFVDRYRRRGGLICQAIRHVEMRANGN